ncbi:MAG TPA: FAD-dependent oxidoreductase, partial [Actinomycetes bacterium]|nr:FAD-dependent oxidoreductase [Actinomycetes bacterium]
PAMLPIPGIDLPGVVTSDGAFLLEEVPRRIVIVGASAVGAEWATMFQAFGSEVTMVELLPRLLPAEDEDIGKALARSFAKRGIKVETGRTVTGIAPVGDQAPPLRVTVADPDGGNQRQVEADLVLVGVGRRPNTAGLDLERAGVATDPRGWVEVDDRLRTSVPGVHAVGDLTGRLLLAHVASHQGLVAAGVMAGHDERMDYRAVPAATFTHPEVASVGLTEAAARDAGHDVAVGRFPFSALGRAQTFGGAEGLVKVVAERGGGQVLGVHVIGPGASDLIPEGVLAMQLEATLADIAGTIHAHPTLGEGTMEAALVALGLPVHLPPSRGPESRARSVKSGRATPAGPARSADPRRPVDPLAPRFDLTVRADVTRVLGERGGAGLGDLVAAACAGLVAVSPELDAFFGEDRLRVASLGVDQFSSVLEPTDGAVLAVGAAQAEARVVDGKVEVRQVARLTLSVDQGVVDGATGGRFLGRLKAALEQGQP